MKTSYFLKNTGLFLALITAFSFASHKHAVASPGSPTKDLQCNNLRLKHRPLFSSYTITDKHLIVKNGVGGGKYPTNRTEIPLPYYKVRISSDYQDIVISATPNIAGEGPFVISRYSCPEFLPDGIELFLR